MYKHHKYKPVWISAMYGYWWKCCHCGHYYQATTNTTAGCPGQRSLEYGYA